MRNSTIAINCKLRKNKIKYCNKYRLKIVNCCSGVNVHDFHPARQRQTSVRHGQDTNTTWKPSTTLVFEGSNSSYLGSLSLVHLRYPSIFLLQYKHMGGKSGKHTCRYLATHILLRKVVTLKKILYVYFGIENNNALTSRVW